jgi:hypothetical protein
MSQLITIEQLVNIRSEPTWTYWKDETNKARAVRIANLERPKEITAFVDALSRMFGRIGMHGVCSLCFKGHLDNGVGRKGHGCCGSCVLLTATKCANKPMGCARFMCAFTSNLFPRTRDFLDRLSQRLYNPADYASRNFGMGCHEEAVERESRFKLTEEKKRRLRWAIRQLNRWSEKA